MNFGANTFIWRSPFSTGQDLDLIPKLKEMGFDLIEVAVEDPALIDLKVLKDALDKDIWAWQESKQSGYERTASC